MKYGLTSVTFRQLDWREIIRIARECNLDGLEWGGDVHVPSGELSHAQKVYQATVEAGLSVLSYGSYYRLGQGQDFEPVLAVALALRADTIRVWAGAKDSAQHSAGERARAIRDAQTIADMAGPHGVTVAFEYHRGTLTDTCESALALLEAVGRENVRTYWQPNPQLAHERNLAELAAVLPWLENVHAFHWTPGGARLPLEEGMAQWRAYLQTINGRAGAAILEFVKNDDPAQCARDAASLRRACD